MVKIEESVVVWRPVGDVFPYVADMSTHPQWDHGCREAAYTSPGPERVGLGYQRTDRFMGMRMRGTGEVMEYEPNQRIAWSIRSMRGKAVFSFEAVEGGTKIHAYYEAKFPWFFTLIGPLTSLMIRRSARKSFRNLKSKLEPAA